MASGLGTNIEKLTYTRLLEEKMRRNRSCVLENTYRRFYDWQLKFNAATQTHKWCLLMAGNQVGKSISGCVLDAHHLTGLYPKNWEGHRFTRPITAWLLGFSGEKTRDLLQNKLFGEMDRHGKKFGGGLIKRSLILNYVRMPGTSGAMRKVNVKHTHGVSSCQFWSYGQGQHALMGDIVDWVHIDEEPKDQEIFPQVVTRTINGDGGKGGRGILTFTPENGRTPLVCQFYDSSHPSRYLQMVAWVECPHLTPERKEEMLAMWPKWQWDMRTKGMPLVGTGLIYDMEEAGFTIDPFKIPPHWWVINGMDFGWDHPQAHIQLVWDKDADIFYVTNAWKGSNCQPYEAWQRIKKWSRKVPTAWPSDGLQREKSSGIQQKWYYEESGFRMLHEAASWESGGNSVWAGLVELNSLMKESRLLIFSNLTPLFQEIRHYHTKSMPSGKSEIVKKDDDLLDALRYAYMMKRHAIPVYKLYEKDISNRPQNFNSHTEFKSSGRDPITGY